MSLTLRPSSSAFETLPNLANRTSNGRCATIENYPYDMTCRTEMDYPTNLKTEGDEVFRDISFGKTTVPTTSPVKVNSSGNNSNEGIEPIMPYHQFSKAKMALHTPFHWNYERGMTEKLSKGSIYLLKEVHPEKLFSLKMDSKPLYQIQPNAERVIGWRKHIADNIKLYYKLHFYERMKIDFSSEYIAVTSDLQKIADTIESARPTNNNDVFAETLLSECLSQEIIDSHAALIEPILNQKFLPTLSQLKNEFYTTGYADDRLAYLIESVSTLFRDINQTIAVVSETKKKFEEATSFSSIKKSRTDKFLSLKNPKLIYDQFLRTITWIKMFKNEVGSFDKLRKLLLTNLKAAIVAQAFGSYGENLYNLNGKLVEVYNQLKKRSQKNKKPNATPIKSRPNIKSPVSLKIKEVIDHGVLDKKHIEGIHQMIQFVDAFTSSVERFCKDMNKKRDEEISEMLTKVTDVLDTFELDLQGFTHSQIILRDVELSIKAILREKQEEVDEVSLAKNYQKIKNQIKTITLALDLNLTGSNGITTALDKAYEKHLTISKKKRFEGGNYLSQDHYYAKIAKIVRRRMKLKNELMTSTYTRVQKSVNLDDVIEFFGSKKIWQSITSKDCHQINIRGFMQNSSKPVYHKISVNPDMEKCVLNFIKTFVSSLA